ncbi:hypothetical protein SLS63_012267 [Diaporthe eres]|uniref:Uncharacterized protein n=1 Tax=Diaporthe eres TaxID=83184 RepID=A0ABR1NRR1_DIAER
MMRAYKRVPFWWFLSIIVVVLNVDANQVNVLSEFIGGYMFQGKPIANILFKILSTDVVGQGLYFASDMKLAHYLKIPLRTLFFAQGIATILGALTQVGVTLWMLGNVEGICTSDQPNGLILPPITYYIFKRTKSEFVRKINWPLIFVGTYNVPPATGVNFSSWYLGLVDKITYGPNLQFPDWWGNTVWQNTADGLGTPWMQMPTIGYFGGANGTWA